MSEAEHAGAFQPRQTKSFLKELLEAHGLRPRSRLGQNFLIDLNLLELLLRSANLGSGDVALEIGAGTGGLTTRLASECGRVVSVEVDPGFHTLVALQTRNMSNVRLLHLNALAGKHRVHPDVLSAVSQAMTEIGAAGYHLVANLPYDIAAPVINNLLLDDLPVRSMTVTIQLEMGQRITAAPGSKDYGPISVLVQWLGQAEWVRTLPPEVFWPRPKVHSAIVRIVVDAERRANLPAIRQWHQFVRNLFLHRRKTLRAALVNLPEFKHRKAEIDRMLPSLGFAADVRAEQLQAGQFQALYSMLQG